MKKIHQYTLLLAFLLTLGACKKFLDINPSTQSVNPSTINDFQEMLNNDSLGTSYFFLLDLMSDDILVYNYTLGATNNIYTRTYLWNSAIWNAGDTDFIYNSSYARILQMNIILSRINSAIQDSLNTPQNKSNVISQALINRAWYYFQLANTYGPAYDKNTASTDLAVPLILTPDNASGKPARASVQQVYTSIITDLKQAVNNPYLPAKGVDIIHPGKASGYALLARTYLYESLYDSARLYADSSLNLVNTLENYNTAYTQPTRLYDLKSNPEVLLGRISIDVGFFQTYGSNLYASTALTDVFGSTDLRYTQNFTWGSFNFSTSSGITELVFDNSVSVPEVLLIKAECLARSGDATDAAAIIKQIRSNRLPTGTIDTSTYNSSNIMNYVLSERRCELFYHGGLRLFDLKRLNKEDAYKQTIYRMQDNSTTVATDSLPPGSNLYLMPFAPFIIANNPNIIQNPR